MTLSAVESGVFAFQQIPGLLVIKLFLRWLPVDEREIQAIMFEVASDAIFPVRITHAEARVVPMIRRQPLRDLFVTVEALECRRAGPELMTTRALRGAG